MLSCKNDEAFQVRDSSIYKDAFGIVAGCVCWESGIGSCCQDEDVIVDCGTGGGLDCFRRGVDCCYSCIEVVIEGSFFERVILVTIGFFIRSYCFGGFPLGYLKAYPFCRIKV